MSSIKRSNGSTSDVINKKIKSRSNDAWTWKEASPHGVYIGERNKGNEHLRRIAAFDFDGTLAVTKSGTPFPKNEDDFLLWSKKLPALIKSLKQTHRIIIFTNQMGVLYNKITPDSVKRRIEGLLELIDSDLSCTVVVATGENNFRKPRRGMFDLLSLGDMEGFYVGDAAGRPKTKDRKKDHSSADFLFAINVGLKFLTPEQFLEIKDFDSVESVSRFHEENERNLSLPAFDPRVALKSSEKFSVEKTSKDQTKISFTSIENLREDITRVAESKKKVLVVVTGLPGSGKSYLVSHLLSDFEDISRDKLGTMEKCAKTLKEVLKRNSCRIVVDNTNTTTEQRSQWIRIAKELKVDIIISVFVNISVDQCLHNNSFRRLLTLKKEGTSNPTVPTFVIKKMSNELVAPNFKEGFDVLYQIKTNIPIFGAESDEETLYFQFL
jgi:bifunctional polynucleotide phosphatase/kinase